tara:strand:- start:22998 stop:23159 length:162 start_codon:yes stop_codon:yes gene_type:complete
MQARVENSKAQSRETPWEAPASEAVVIVPGPMKAAEMTDQKRMLRSFFFKREV